MRVMRGKRAGQNATGRARRGTRELLRQIGRREIEVSSEVPPHPQPPLPRRGEGRKNSERGLLYANCDPNSFARSKPPLLSAFSPLAPRGRGAGGEGAKSHGSATRSLVYGIPVSEAHASRAGRATSAEIRSLEAEPRESVFPSGEAVNFSKFASRRHCPVSDGALKRSTHFMEAIA